MTDLRGEWYPVRPPDLHLYRGDTPLRSSQVELGPFGFSEFAGPENSGASFRAYRVTACPSKPDSSTEKAMARVKCSFKLLPPTILCTFG